MALEQLTQLEGRISEVMELLSLQKMEIEELRETKSDLEADNQRLKDDIKSWEEQLSGILGKLGSVEEEATL
ncbi:cell division protein ZapB [Pelagibaculum spongiae]|uniref:Cell division protein ZapB n=1 Tax=Pelagibaculum spongiae TaxID=2080658 RepID=A0A2V1GYH2_9GAMM|nr:cell division protein ZapB [Pelagibaculum spongiae]PVZ67724.1 cell division protein ZapB [Pelagibaculum spongiae]